MRNDIFKTVLLYCTVLFLLLGFSACETTKQDAEYAKAGVLVSDNILNLYHDYLNQNFTQKSEKELIAILSNPTLTSNQLPKTDDLQKAKNVELKLEALKAYKKVFSIYNLISDKQFNIQNSGLGDAIDNACDLLDSLNPEGVKDQKKLLSDIRLAVTEKRFHKYTVISILTDIYAQILTADRKTWETQMEVYLNDYETGIDNISSSVFDEAKLTKQITGPYTGKEVLVNLYKQELKQKARNEVHAKMVKLDALNQALELIVLINKEFTKKQPDKKYIDQMIARVNELVKTEAAKKL